MVLIYGYFSYFSYMSQYSRGFSLADRRSQRTAFLCEKYPSRVRNEAAVPEKTKADSSTRPRRFAAADGSE
jgi:hypothetical protein